MQLSGKENIGDEVSRQQPGSKLYKNKEEIPITTAYSANNEVDRISDHR